eukprot:scaffold1371_cov55-Phaeocystis_antarctica.AAC.4
MKSLYLSYETGYSGTTTYVRRPPICARSGHSLGRARASRRGSGASRSPCLPKAVKWAALEAARSSPRGGGWALSGPAFSWECRAARSRQARSEEAQEPSWGTARRAV